MERPITVQKVSTSIIWRIYSSQVANENGGECLLLQTAFCERWGSNLFSLRGAVLPPPSDCHSFNEELTYLRGMIQEQSIRQLIGCGSKMEVKKSTVLHYLCVCACACMCCWCLLSLGWVSFKKQKKRKCSVYTEYVSRSVNTGRWEQKHFSDNVKDAFKQE